VEQRTTGGPTTNSDVRPQRSLQRAVASWGTAPSVRNAARVAVKLWFCRIAPVPHRSSSK